MMATAVMEAKNEVVERKKELDATKDKMDRLVDKLYVGRDRGLQLQVSINAAQEHQVIGMQCRPSLLRPQSDGTSMRPWSLQGREGSPESHLFMPPASLLAFRVEQCRS